MTIFPTRVYVSWRQVLCPSHLCFITFYLLHNRSFINICWVNIRRTILVKFMTMNNFKIRDWADAGKKSPVSWISLKLRYPVYHYWILNKNWKIGSSFSLDMWSTQGPLVLSGECMDIPMSQTVLFDNTGVVRGNSKFPDLCSWAKSPWFHLSQSPHLLFLISPVWHTGGSFAVFRYSNLLPQDKKCLSLIVWIY